MVATLRNLSGNSLSALSQMVLTGAVTDCSMHYPLCFVQAFRLRGIILDYLFPSYSIQGSYLLNLPRRASFTSVLNSDPPDCELSISHTFFLNEAATVLQFCNRSRQGI